MACLYRRGRIWWIKYRVHGETVYESLDTDDQEIIEPSFLTLHGDS